MSINRSCQLIITIVDLEIDSGAKKPPLIKVVILGAIVDETTICLHQVNRNSLILQFIPLFTYWVSFFRGASNFKK